jgi:hypothetical protein
MFKNSTSPVSLLLLCFIFSLHQHQRAPVSEKEMAGKDGKNNKRKN